MNDNRLIAEFMGHKLGLDGDGMGEPQCRIFENGLGTKRIEDTYSKSWDWLMPVLKKINLRLHPDTYGMWRRINVPTEYTIEEVHAQVVEFIKEYNDER